MEGCQHNTMDVEYYGPNGQMAIWYLGALRACEEMARHLGEDEFADRCRCLFESGSKWIDANMFNGEYYEHLIQPMTADQIAPGLRHPSMGAGDLSDPDFQLGPGEREEDAAKHHEAQLQAKFDGTFQSHAHVCSRGRSGGADEHVSAGATAEEALLILQ